MRGGLVHFPGLDWAGMKVGAALLLLVGLWLPWLVVFGAASLELVSNFLWREWNWSGCGGGFVILLDSLYFFSLFITFSGSVAWVAGFPDEFFLLSVWLGDASGLLSVVFLLGILIFFSFSVIGRFAATSGAGSTFENPSDRVF